MRKEPMQVKKERERDKEQNGVREKERRKRYPSAMNSKG